MINKRKQGKFKTLKDLIPEDVQPGSSNDGGMPQMPTIKYDAEFNSKIKLYNTLIEDLDPRFTSLTPVSKVLVRVFLKELTVENGVYIPNTTFVKLPTHQGSGYVGEVQNPFPYSKKAIVVAAPESTDFKAGQIVILSANPITAVSTGSGKEATITIPASFTHPDIDIELTPDVNNPNYGYLLVDRYAIEFILNK